MAKRSPTLTTTISIPALDLSDLGAVRKSLNKLLNSPVFAKSLAKLAADVASDVPRPRGCRLSIKGETGTGGSGGSVTLQCDL